MSLSYSDWFLVKSGWQIDRDNPARQAGPDGVSPLTDDD